MCKSYKAETVDSLTRCPHLDAAMVRPPSVPSREKENPCSLCGAGFGSTDASAELWTELKELEAVTNLVIGGYWPNERVKKWIRRS